MFYLKDHIFVFENLVHTVDGNMYAKIIKYDADLNYKSRFLLPVFTTTGFSCIIRHGNYFYAGTLNLRIHKIQYSDLTTTRLFESSSTSILQHCNAMVIDKYNNLYVGGRTYHTGHPNTFALMKFNAVTLEFKSFMAGHTNITTDLVCDDDYLYSVNYDFTVRKWNLLTEEQEAVWGGIGLGLTAVEVNDKYIFIGTVLSSNLVHLYKLDKNTLEILQTKEFSHPDHGYLLGDINKLNINREGFLEVFCGSFLYFYDPENFEIISSLGVGGYIITNLEFEEF
jgi:WD40 repeat protein